MCGAEILIQRLYGPDDIILVADEPHEHHVLLVAQVVAKELFGDGEVVLD